MCCPHSQKQTSFNQASCDVAPVHKKFIWPKVTAGVMRRNSQAYILIAGVLYSGCFEPENKDAMGIEEKPMRESLVHEGKR